MSKIINERVNKLIYESLVNKIEEVSKILDSAQCCADEGDYLQCAVRLESVGVLHDNVLMNIFDAYSKNDQP